MNIRLHIERVILDGVGIAPGEAALVQAAIEAELGRLLTEGGLAHPLRSGGATADLTGDDVRLTTHSDPTQLGQDIARASYASIGVAPPRGATRSGAAPRR